MFNQLSDPFEWRVIRAIIRKDLTEWRHQPRTIFITFIPSLIFVAILAVSVTAVGRNKVALVVEGSGPHTQQLVRTLRDSPAFIITDSNAADASNMLKALQIEAVITIPATFDAAYDVHQADPVSIDINNLNLDFTNDLRRSLPAAIADFYSQQSDTPIRVGVAETDLRTHDIDLLQFDLVPLLVQLLTLAGVVNTGLAMAREWETFTIKELYMAPIRRRSLIIGKVLAGWIITLAFAALTLALATIGGFFHPVGIYWLVTIIVVALIGLTSVGIGVALATLLRREQRVIVVGINVTFYLFFLSGGISVIAFLPSWIRTIAQFIPTFYGVHALEMAVFYNSSDLLGRDIAVLALTTIVALTIGALALRRRLFS